jgi:hypothetical protein
VKYRPAKMTESRDRWQAEVRCLRKSMTEETAHAVEEPSKDRAGSIFRGRRKRPGDLDSRGELPTLRYCDRLLIDRQRKSHPLSGRSWKRHEFFMLSK